MPAADGALPAIWELQQASLWPPFMAAQRCCRLEPCLESFADAAVAATKSAISAHLHACVQALLKSDRGAGGATAPPDSAPMEDLLQWLRPAAFLALLQGLALQLRVVNWFYEGCGVLMDAALAAVQVWAIVCISGNNQSLLSTSQPRSLYTQIQPTRCGSLCLIIPPSVAVCRARQQSRNLSRRQAAG